MSKKDNDINWQLIHNSGGANPEDYLTPKQLQRYNEKRERFIDIDIDLAMNQEEGLDEVIKKQDEDLTEKYKELQNPQDPNILEETLKEKSKQDIIEEAMGPDEDDDEGLSQYALNRLKLNQTRFTDPNRFQNQLDSFPEMTMQDISETYTDFKAGAMGGSLLQDYLPLPKGVVPAAAGTATALIKNVFESSFFKNKEPITVYALGKKRFNLKRLGYFPDTKDAVSQFGQEAVDEFMEKARLHRVSRSGLGKQELMKDFNETLDIIRDDGTEEIAFVVKRKNTPNKLDPTDSANFHVRTLSQVMKQMRVETKWLNQQLPEVKAMQIIRTKLNQLGDKYSDDLVLAKLMEYGDEAYLEHMIAKDQYTWIWDQIEAYNREPYKKNKIRPYPWIQAPERNHVDNLRLLVSRPYKTLKDQTEGRIRTLYNDNLVRKKDFKNAYIVNIEDPMTNPYTKANPLHKSNPGNILIQMASRSDKAPKTIGIVGDYLQDFYGKDFTKYYNGNELLTVFKQMSPDDKKLYSLYKPKVIGRNVETATAYRRRVLNERIQLIVNEKGKFTNEEIQKEVFKDLLDFYELFSSKTQFVRRPQYVDDIMERSAKKVVDLPFDNNAHLEFYSQKRRAMKDLYTDIDAYEKGLTPRMTKKDYNNLWKQITEVGAMNYNFKADINDFQKNFLRIIGKYE